MPRSHPRNIAAEIPQRERDIELGLEDPKWPESGCPLGADETAPEGATKWRRRPGYLERTVPIGTHRLFEAMVRFPNAPVYGLHERPPRQPEIKGRSNFHTFRILADLERRNKQPSSPKEPIQDVYILHNGLNETRDFDLHYQLAAEILDQATRPSLCIIRPFPGHLTRFPYSDLFAEKPLDTYLLDSGDLFRQFTRFMLETRWLLSILSPRISYSVITGGNLVQCEEWRETDKLAEAIFDEWNAMDEAAPEDRRRAREEGENPDVSKGAIEATIDVLRKRLLAWSRHSEPLPTRGKESPAIHMVGYSLGGFMAQSAFFAWPYAISGSITLFGGGELRKLSPTAFAQPEEWQSVLHSLRYELDRAMREGTQSPEGPDENMVQGIDRENFEYLRRVFYEVFLQYYQGSYRTRLTEFIQRMLFVTGGHDPIVRPDNVLDAGPQEGVNLINIAGMSHFPTKPKEKVQSHQRDFWIKQLGRIIPDFSGHADDRRLEALSRSWLDGSGTTLHPLADQAYQEYQKELDEVGEPPTVSWVGSGSPLADRWFGKEIERICDQIGNGRQGWVLVSRNEVPPVFQTEAVMKGYAAGLHHSEDLAADEFWLATKRREALLNGRPRVTLMVTRFGYEGAFQEKSVAPSLFPSRSETPGVPRLSQEELDAAKAYFDGNWLDLQPPAVRQLSNGEFRPEQLGELGPVICQLLELEEASAATRISVRFLPDTWVGFSPELLAELRDGDEPEDPAEARACVERAIADWGKVICEERIAKREWDRDHEHDEEDSDPDLSEPSAPANDLLGTALKERWLTIVEFSRAGLNPRYRGLRITQRRRAGEILIHWALAYQAAGVEPDVEPPAV